MKQQIIKNRAQEINNLHSEICESLRTTVEKAIRIGELLVEQKKECGHGNWMSWVKNNLIFGHSTVTQYIRMFYNKAKLLLDSNLTFIELANNTIRPSIEETAERQQREMELNDKAEKIAMQRIGLEEDEKELKKERQIIEKEDFDKEDFGKEVELDESDAEFEKRINRFIELHKRFEGQKRDKQKLSEKQIAEWVHKVWQSIIIHDPLSEINRERIARATIKMLYKKYPRLMDEP